MGRADEARAEQVLARHIKKVTEDRSQLLRLVSISEDDPAPALALASLELSEGRFAEAERWLGRAGALGAAETDVAELRAEAQFLQGYEAGGEAELGPFGADGVPLLARAAGALARNKVNEATGLLEQLAAERAPGCARLRRGAAMYRIAGRPAEAVAMLERAEGEPSVLDAFAEGLGANTP